MTHLEQLLIIVEKEIKSKKMLMDNDGNTDETRSYWQGGMMTLIYIKRIITEMLKETEE